MQLININNVQTMSSSEIAELTNKQHSNVTRVIEDLLDKQIIQCPQIEEQAYNKGLDKVGTRKVYYLAKRDTLVLVARLSPEFTAAAIDRWQELENNHPKVPANFIEAMTLALEQAKQLELQAPKVQAFDALIGADTIFSMNQTAKLLGWGRNKLFAELRKRGILMESNLPYQEHVNNGRFVVRDTPIQRTIGTVVISQTYCTTKGQVWLHSLLNEVK